MLLSKEDKVSFLIGMVLGDGYIRKGKNAVNYNISCTHNPKQYEYMLWKMEILKENLNKNYWTNKMKTHFSGKAVFTGNKDKIYEMYKSVLGTHTLVTNLYKRMYNENGKYVSKSILNELTPIGIAIWFMDDGTLSIVKHKDGRNKTKRIFLHIQGFDSKSQKNIQEFFNDNYNLNASLQRDRNHFRLYIPAASVDLFLNIVSPFVSLVACMRYKITY